MMELILCLELLDIPVQLNNNLVLTGKYKKIGISPPEYLGEHFEFVKDYLEERGVIYKKNKK